jgi:hypothetical protein
MSGRLRQKRPWVFIRSGDGKGRTLPLSCVLMRWDRIAFALQFAPELHLDPRRQVRHILLHLGDVGFWFGLPALTLTTGMPILNANGSLLVAVTAFGLTTAASYAFSGFVDWPLALMFVAGALLEVCLTRGSRRASPTNELR